MGFGRPSGSLMAKPVGEDDVSRGYNVYFNRPGVAVVIWDPKLQAVYAEAQGFADSTELAALLEAGLQALTEHRGSRWLIDGRNMTVIKQSDQDWIDQKFFPRALAGGLKRMGWVIPKSGLAMMNVDQLVRRLPSARFEAAYFATVEEARSWLTGSRSPTRVIV
jgi:hypothetical protein